mmetsp:Transcript_9947/g.26373  ORF Transcript_9947/g.26373 Transcript_9947/m.26373 type:complete len:249 (+) Transcript_9947:393-1139(+)
MLQTQLSPIANYARLAIYLEMHPGNSSRNLHVMRTEYLDGATVLAFNSRDRPSFAEPSFEKAYQYGCEIDSGYAIGSLFGMTSWVLPSRLRRNAMNTLVLPIWHSAQRRNKLGQCSVHVTLSFTSFFSFLPIPPATCLFLLVEASFSPSVIMSYSSLKSLVSYPPRRRAVSMHLAFISRLKLANCPLAHPAPCRSLKIQAKFRIISFPYLRVFALYLLNDIINHFYRENRCGVNIFSMDAPKCPSNFI